MFKVIDLDTSDIVNVYGVSKDGELSYFLIYSPDYEWCWVSSTYFKPFEN